LKQKLQSLEQQLKAVEDYQEIKNRNESVSSQVSKNETGLEIVNKKLEELKEEKAK
jgi:hypothetical protein